MKRSLIATLLVGGLMFGCKPKDTGSTSAPAAPDAAATQTPSADSAPANAGSTPAPVEMPVTLVNTNAAVIPEGDPSATLGMLTSRLRGWVAGSHIMPQNFEQFAAANPNLQIPPPPAGKKYAIGPKLHVILVTK